MAIRFDQTTSWIMATLVAGSLFLGIYFIFRYEAGRRESAAIEESDHTKKSPDSHDTKEFLPEVPALWGYSGSRSPGKWASLDDSYSLCGSGKSQSPIDIGDARGDSHLKPVVIRYEDSSVTLALNGGDLSGNIAAGGHLEFEGDRFPLKRVVFHLPAEHKRLGIPYPMEIQLHHQDVAGHQLILSVFVEQGKSHEGLAMLAKNLPEEDLHQRDIDHVSWSALLPSKKNYFTYQGSLSQPPCTEGVRWVVMTAFITAAPADLQRFQKVTGHNARPVQALSGREIRRSIR